MKKILSTTVTAVAIIAVSGLAGYDAQAGATVGQGRPTQSRCHLTQQEVDDWGDSSSHLAQACDRDPYTTLDHPAKPCHLSPAAVANWGETSAHLPLACTYR